MSYRIQTLTLKGDKLSFSNVDCYSIVEGDFIEFVDKKTGKTKRFHASRCEIDDEDQSVTRVEHGGHNKEQG